MKLKSNVAVVTGGSRGIGAAISLKLAAAGATVAIVYRSNTTEAQSLMDKITASGGSAAIFAADVASVTDVQNVIDAIVARFGQINILVNNAGVFEARPFGAIDAAHVERMFSVNLGSMLYMTQAAVPHFPKTGGRIVNISSSLMYAPRPGTGIYAASKAAVSVMTGAFARELGTRGITVNAVAPATTRTDMTADISEERSRDVIARTPAGRLGEPDDIAEVVMFLASEAGRWINGRTLLTDGGLTDGF